MTDWEGMDVACMIKTKTTSETAGCHYRVHWWPRDLISDKKCVSSITKTAVQLLILKWFVEGF